MRSNNWVSTYQPRVLMWYLQITNYPLELQVAILKVSYIIHYEHQKYDTTYWVKFTCCAMRVVLFYEE